MKTVLVLVLSCTAPLYEALMAAQLRTWESIVQPGVLTFFYVGGFPETKFDGKIIQCACPDKLGFALAKLKIALRTVLEFKWDFLFRTNSSSYVRKHKLIEFAQTIPESNCYCGSISTFEGVPYVSGVEIFMSRDVAQYLVEKLPDVEDWRPEDCAIGQHLASNGIVAVPGRRRINYYATSERPEDCYLYRCKPADHRDDPSKDIAAFDWLFTHLDHDRRTTRPDSP